MRVIPETSFMNTSMISVLFVDDDSAHLEITKRFLEEHGELAVTTALSAREALKMMETNRFDAIVSDYQMPGMDGIELLKAVRAEKPHLPFILFTGKGREEVVIEAFRNGTDFYLQKGGEPKILFANLKDTIKNAVKIRAERKEFHNSEIRYRRLFETAKDGILILDAESGEITDANPLLLSLLGYTREEILGKSIWEIGIIREKSRAEQAADELKKTGYIRYDNLPVKTKDGRDIAVELVSNTYDVETQKVTQCTIRDITERSRAEEEHGRLAAIVECSDAAIIGKTMDGTITSWNEGAKRIYGYPAQEIIGSSVSLLVPQDQPDDMREILDRIRNGEPVIRYETLRRKKDGGQINVTQIVSPIKDAHGHFIGVSTISHDITEQKRTQEALAKSEERYRTLAEASPDQIFINGRDGTIEYVNTTALKLFHLSYDQVIGKLRKDLFPLEIFTSQETSLQKVFETGEIVRREDIIQFGEKKLWIDTDLVPLKDGTGIVTSVLGVARDITERKIAEDALKKTSTLLNEVCEMARVGGWEVDVTTKEVHWTKETYRIHEIPEAEKIDLPNALSFYDLPGRSTLETALQRCMEMEEPFDLDLPFTSARGKHHWIRAMGHAVNVDSKVVKLTGTFQDITELKAAEEAIITFNDDLDRKVRERTSDLSNINLNLTTEIGIRLNAEKELNKTVGQKEILLREVHHRVKNNLQIIISLLNLQSRYIKDEATRSAFRESQSRVRAMALVHEKLYQSTDIGKLDLGNYLKFLGDNLFQFFGMKGKGITLTMDIRNVFLAIDTAIPLGLIINELISNSLKYAFPEGRKGEISLMIHQQGYTLTLQYKDNGIGIPKDFDWRNAESLGLRLIISLVDQLDGTIELDQSSGTMFTIIVKEKA